MEAALIEDPDLLLLQTKNIIETLKTETTATLDEALKGLHATLFNLDPYFDTASKFSIEKVQKQNAWFLQRYRAAEGLFQECSAIGSWSDEHQNSYIKKLVDHRQLLIISFVGIALGLLGSYQSCTCTVGATCDALRRKLDVLCLKAECLLLLSSL